MDNDFARKRTWAEVSLDNVRHNYLAIRASIPTGCRFLGVVKANAYGHGAVKVAKLLEGLGADYLAVACLDEAVELREAGITMPILILGSTPSRYTDTLVEYGITQSVTSLAAAEEYSAAAVGVGELKVHIKVDTGMSRLGFICAGEAFDRGVGDIAAACALPSLHAEGIFTHFAVSDEEVEENRAYTEKQFGLFTAVIDALADRGVRFAIRHCANSGAVLHYPEMTLDMVRPGLLLYGYGDGEGKLGLRPCMSLFTRICTVKTYSHDTSISYGRHFVTGAETRIGVLGIGYADGLMRALSNRTAFYTAGGFAPQRGNICMDMCMIDLTALLDAHEGDPVEIFGEKNDLNKLSTTAGTIPNELLCAVSKRVPRLYTGE